MERDPEAKPELYPFTGRNELVKVKFYNLKKRQSVDVDESQIRKKKIVRKTKDGKTQYRYQLIAEHNGEKLFKFVNEKTYNELNVPEV
jgi:hypothetical protein